MFRWFSLEAKLTVEQQNLWNVKRISITFKKKFQQKTLILCYFLGSFEIPKFFFNCSVCVGLFPIFPLRFKDNSCGQHHIWNFFIFFEGSWNVFDFKCFIVSPKKFYKVSPVTVSQQLAIYFGLFNPIKNCHLFSIVCFFSRTKKIFLKTLYMIEPGSGGLVVLFCDLWTTPLDWRRKKESSGWFCTFYFNPLSGRF